MIMDTEVEVNKPKPRQSNTRTYLAYSLISMAFFSNSHCVIKVMHHQTSFFIDDQLSADRNLMNYDSTIETSNYVDRFKFY